MARLRDEIYRPTAERHKKYTGLYNEYIQLHDYFGQGGNNVMKRLREIRML